MAPMKQRFDFPLKKTTSAAECCFTQSQKTTQSRTCHQQEDGAVISLLFSP
jgi:hypothetical protein